MDYPRWPTTKEFREIKMNFIRLLEFFVVWSVSNGWNMENHLFAKKWPTSSHPTRFVFIERIVCITLHFDKLRASNHNNSSATCSSTKNPWDVSLFVLYVRWPVLLSYNSFFTIFFHTFSLSKNFVWLFSVCWSFVDLFLVIRFV